MNEPQEFPVTAADAGTRLDLFVVAKLGVTRGEAKRLLGDGAVWLNKRQAHDKDKGLLLREGSVVRVEQVADAQSQAPIAEPDAPLDILAQAEGWIVVNKPSGMPVHPLQRGETGTVLNAVVARFPQVVGVGEAGLRSGVVHRLDVETSGVLVMATTQAAWERLRDAFHHHQTDKLYRAIIQDELYGSGMERMWLAVSQHSPARARKVEDPDPLQVSKSTGGVATGPGGARLCDLTWKAVATMRGATVIEVRLGTGFLHQIRVMMAESGHPVIGDLLYGADKNRAPRPMLHASQITIDGVTAIAPEPEDFAKLTASAVPVPE